MNHRGQRKASRERDEEVLGWVYLRARGFNTSQIARMLRCKSGPKEIAKLTDRVMLADTAEAGFWGDDITAVLLQYWRRRKYEAKV